MCWLALFHIKFVSKKEIVLTEQWILLTKKKAKKQVENEIRKYL